MKRLLLSLFVTVWIVSPQPPTATVPITVDDAASDVQITVTLTFGTTDTDGPKPVNFSGGGTARSRFELEGALAPYGTSLNPGPNRIAASDVSFDLTVIQLFVPINFLIQGSGLSGSISGGRWTAGAPIAQGTTELNTNGSQLILDQGLMQVTSSLGVNETVDLSVTPLPFDLTGTATLVTEKNGSLYDLEISLPLDQTATIVQMGITVDVTIQGTVVLRGRTPLKPQLAPVPILLP